MGYEKYIGVRLKKETLEKLEGLADHNTNTVSAEVRRAIVWYLRQNEDNSDYLVSS